MPLSSVQYLARISTMQPRWAICVDCGPFYPACMVLASHAGIFRETCIVVLSSAGVCEKGENTSSPKKACVGG